MKALVIYHRSCCDGFTAAWAFWRWVQEGKSKGWPEGWPRGVKARYLPAHYNEPLIKPAPDEDVFLLDFSYKEDELRELKGMTQGKLTVIDHHKTAKEHVVGLGKPWNASFDLEHSGARLTWDYFHKEGAPRPKIIDFVEARDLWKQDTLEHTDLVHAWLTAHEFDFVVWDDLAYRLENDWDGVYKEGNAIMMFKKRQIDITVSHGIEAELLGKRGRVVNTNHYFSEVAGELSEGYEFGCAYFRRKDGIWQYSLRSRHGCDVSDLAKALGGGGHPGAAGFQTETLIF